MTLVLTVEGGTARRALDAVLAAAGAAHESGRADEPGEGPYVLDVLARVVRTPDRTVPVVLCTPAVGEVGIVEDLLIDRAFPDVPGEATVLAELAELPVMSVEDLHEALAAAALARALGVSADAVRHGLAALHH